MRDNFCTVVPFLHPSLTVAGVRLKQHAFFKTNMLLITLVFLGRLIAAFARARAAQAVWMRSLQPRETLLL